MDAAHALDVLVGFLDGYGYWIFAGVGFAEFAGAPLASSAVLVAAGALAAGGGLSFPGVVAAAAAGALVADALWFALGRWQGHRALALACGLTSNPGACVLEVRRRLELLGSPYVLVAKFLPGTANLVAPAAGLARLPAGVFLPNAALALTGWAALYTGLGWIFSAEVEAVIAVLLGYLPWVAAGALALVLGAGAWRWIRVRRHATAHGTGRGGDDR